VPSCSTLLIKQGCHSERSGPLSSPPAPEQWIRDFPRGRGVVHKHRALKFLPKELTLFEEKYVGSSSLRMFLREKNGDFGGKQLRGGLVAPLEQRSKLLEYQRVRGK